MQRIPIKPLSVNQTWQGKRFKTKAYKVFERAVSVILNTLRPRPVKPPACPLFASYRFGMSNILADVDNPVKIFQDVLFEHWKDKKNDHRVHLLIAEKVQVPKGEEFIEFEVDTLDNVIPYLESLIEELKGTK